MGKQFFIFLCIVVVKSFEVGDYYDDASTNTTTSFEEFILGAGRLSADPSGSGPSARPGGDSPLSTNTTANTTSTNITTSFRNSEATTTATTRKVEAGSGNNGEEIKRGDQQSASNATGYSKSGSPDDLLNSTAGTNGTISEQPAGANTGSTEQTTTLENSLENSFIKILLKIIEQHLDSTRVERDHPNPYGPVNFLITNYFDIFISTVSIVSKIINFLISG